MRSWPLTARRAIFAALTACLASAASRWKVNRWTWIRRSSRSEISPFSARKRWMRSSSSSVFKFPSARARVSRATRMSVNDFFTWRTVCRCRSASSYPVTRVAALALSSRRWRLPPSSMGWPTLSVYCVVAAPPRTGS